MKKFYVTTAIDYVNGAPHLGHAYEKICTDIIARWHSLLGENIFFLTGTDENAQKNVKAAKEADIAVKEFIDKNSKKFVELCKKLNISNNDFIRTTENRHVKVAQAIFKKLYDRGDIYKGEYEGLYCVGCEAFITGKDLVDGKCPEHKIEPEIIKEEDFFFRLNNYQNQISKLLEKKDFLLPEERRKEIISRLKSEKLKDLCISRKNVEWGIKTPIDKNYTIYVWIDALSNYISALGYPNNKEFKKYWPADLHVIGKGINWFHSVIWPALLISLGIDLPKKIFVHGYITIDGQKISKSLGNVIDPIYLVNKYGTDALRYFLIRNIPFGQDGDFSENALRERYNNELADKLGNLVSRVSALAEKYGINKTTNRLIKKLKLKDIEKGMENYQLDKVLALIFGFIDNCNEYIQEKQPWQTHDKKILYELADSIKTIAILLWPFIPETSEKIAKQFGFEIKSLNDCKVGLKNVRIKKGSILFEKIKD